MDYTYSGIIGTLMTQDTATEGSVAQMWVMKMEGYGVQGRTTVRLQELMQGVALPETIPDIACIVPQGRLALSDVSMLPEKPPLLSDPVVIGAVELGSQGDLSMFVLLDEQEQPWTFFIRTQQADESTATTVKHVVCSLENDLSEYSALPQISPVAWTNWHHGLDNVPTVSVQATGVAAAEQSAKVPFDRVVYMYVSISTLSPSEESTLRQAMAAGHPWLQRTVVLSSHMRNGYFRRMGAFSNDALRYAILDKLQ